MFVKITKTQVGYDPIILQVLHRSRNPLHERLNFLQSNFACQCCLLHITDSHNKTTRDVKFKLFSLLSLSFQADVNRYIRYVVLWFKVECRKSCPTTKSKANTGQS